MKGMAAVAAPAEMAGIAAPVSVDSAASRCCGPGSPSCLEVSIDEACRSLPCECLNQKDDAGESGALCPERDAVAEAGAAVEPAVGDAVNCGGEEEDSGEHGRDVFRAGRVGGDLLQDELCGRQVLCAEEDPGEADEVEGEQGTGDAAGEGRFRFAMPRCLRRRVRQRVSR